MTDFLLGIKPNNSPSMLTHGWSFLDQEEDLEEGAGDENGIK